MDPAADQNPYKSPDGETGKSDDRGFNGTGPGAGFIVIVIVNCFWMVCGLFMFVLGLSESGYAPFLAIILGLPLICLQLLLGWLPAGLYRNQHARLLTRNHIRALWVFPTVAITLTLAGVFLSLALPHGSPFCF